MIVHPDVDGYIKTLHHMKYCGVLLTSNQLNMVVKFQCYHWSNLLR